MLALASAALLQTKRKRGRTTAAEVSPPGPARPPADWAVHLTALNPCAAGKGARGCSRSAARHGGFSVLRGALTIVVAGQGTAQPLWQAREAAGAAVGAAAGAAA